MSDYFDYGPQPEPEPEPQPEPEPEIAPIDLRYLMIEGIWVMTDYYFENAKRTGQPVIIEYNNDKTFTLNIQAYGVNNAGVVTTTEYVINEDNNFEFDNVDALDYKYRYKPTEDYMIWWYEPFNSGGNEGGIAAGEKYFLWTRVVNPPRYIRIQINNEKIPDEDEWAALGGNPDDYKINFSEIIFIDENGNEFYGNDTNKFSQSLASHTYFYPGQNTSFPTSNLYNGNLTDFATTGGGSNSTPSFTNFDGNNAAIVIDLCAGDATAIPPQISKIKIYNRYHADGPRKRGSSTILSINVFK